jgi:hypothetical protein
MLGWGGVARMGVDDSKRSRTRITTSHNGPPIPVHIVIESFFLTSKPRLIKSLV